MTQLGLDFSPPRARRSDPDTAHTAAKRVAPKVGALECAVVGALRRHPAGLTAPEIAQMVGARDGSISPRIKPLRKRGLVADSGQRRNGATVWMAY